MRTSVVSTNKEGATIYKSSKILDGWTDVAMLSFRESVIHQDSDNMEKNTSILKTQCKKLEHIFEYLSSQCQTEEDGKFDRDTYEEVKDAILKDFDEEDGPTLKEPKERNPFEVKKIEELKTSLEALEKELTFLEAYEEIVASELNGPEEEEGADIQINADGAMLQANVGGLNIGLNGGGQQSGGLNIGLNGGGQQSGGLNIGLNTGGQVGISGKVGISGGF